MTHAAQLPKCISVLICDDVYRDEATKKLVIVGTFNQIHAPEIPCRHQRMHVLFSLADGHGEFDLCVRVEHAESGNTLVEMRGPAQLTDRLQITDINIVLENLEFAAPGKYWISILADDDEIGARPFFVQHGGDAMNSE